MGVMSMVRSLKMGQLFKQGHLIQRERTASWAVALALAAYALGLSFRKTAQLLRGLGVPISHVAIWYWVAMRVREDEDARASESKLETCGAPLVSHGALRHAHARFWTSGLGGPLEEPDRDQEADQPPASQDPEV